MKMRLLPALAGRRAAAGAVAVASVAVAQSQFSLVSWLASLDDGQTWQGGTVEVADPFARVRIRATLAWCRATDCSAKIIAVVDTGVAYNHPDLKCNMWENPGETPGNGIDDDNNGIIDDVHGAMFQAYCCGFGPVCRPLQEDPAAPSPCVYLQGYCGYDWPQGDPRGADQWLNHGTFVASIIGAVGNNAEHVAGVCWTVKMMAVAVAPNAEVDGRDCNFDTCFLGNEQIGYIQALEYAMLMGASIINCSWGFSEEPLGFKDLFDYAQQNDILIVVIAHNQGLDLDTVQYQTPGTGYIGKVIPALFKREFGYDNVIVTTALGLDGAFPTWASFGLLTVDIAAYSPCVRTIDPDQADPTYCGCGWFGGTSAAAPQIAGAAGLIWTANPTWTAKDVVDRILGTARQPNPNNLLGRCATEGVLDLDAALP